MAYDPEGTNTVATTPKVWSRDILRTHKTKGFWPRFVGSGALKQKTELLNKPGDIIHVPVTHPLSGSGKRGSVITPGVNNDGAKLEGYEENLSTSAIKCAPDLQRHAVRYNRRMDKRNVVSLRAEAKMRLAEWGMVRSDDDRFRLFLSDGSDGAVVGADDELPVAGEAYTPNYYRVGGGANIDALTPTDLLTVEEVQQIKLACVEQEMRPIRTQDGEDIFVGVISPRMALGLKRDSEYQEYVKMARERATTNPLFTGALAMIDGIVLFQHLRVPVVTNANATPADVGKGIVFGDEAFVEALDENVGGETETFDYGLELGFSYEFAFQPRRGLEQNSIQVQAAEKANA